MTFQIELPEQTMKRTRFVRLLIQLLMLAVLSSSSCVTETVTTPLRNQTEKPQGFFGRLADQITERECNVVRFTCPYGLGPADEPCECTDPKGVVLRGTTIK
jgi:hypothetical protein